MLQPSFKKYEAMGWRFIWFVSGLLLSPAKDVQFWTKAARIHFFERHPTIPEGPTCHFPSPVKSDAAVGKIKVGPNPSSQFPAIDGAGDRFSIQIVSPNAVVCLISVCG